MKPLYLAGVAGAGVAVAIAVMLLYAVPAQVVRVHQSGPFTASVLEDSSHRFLAKVENDGPPLKTRPRLQSKGGSTATASSRPEWWPISRLKTGGGGKTVLDPSSLPAKGSVTVDSATTNVSQIPASSETAIYVLKVATDPIRATQLVQEIPIQQSNMAELQQFEDCLAKSRAGYPLLFKLTNVPKGSLAYFTVDEGPTKYTTSTRAQQNSPDFADIYWPDAKQNWSKGNFTGPGGPVPAWKEPHTIKVNIRTAMSGQVQEFERQVQLSDDRLKTASLDFFEVAKGNVMPAYPKYREIGVDLQNRIIS